MPKPTLIARPAILIAIVAAIALPLTACGGSSNHLIPPAKAAPLQDDFEAVYAAASEAEGDCSATKAALARTHSDFQRLPSTVAASLRQTLRAGISNLRSVALRACRQPTASPTTSTMTSTTTSSTTSTSTSTTTTTSSTATEETSATSSTTSYPAYPEEGEEEGEEPTGSSHGGAVAPEGEGEPAYEEQSYYEE